MGCKHFRKKKHEKRCLKHQLFVLLMIFRQQLKVEKLDIVPSVPCKVAGLLYCYDYLYPSLMTQQLLQRVPLLQLAGL